MRHGICYSGHHFFSVVFFCFVLYIGVFVFIYTTFRGVSLEYYVQLLHHSFLLWSIHCFAKYFFISIINNSIFKWWEFTFDLSSQWRVLIGLILWFEIYSVNDLLENREFRIHEYLLLFDFVVGIAKVIIHYSITSSNASILCLL